MPIFFFLLFFPSLAFADIYQSTLPDGSSFFSDTDSKGAKKVTLSEGNISVIPMGATPLQNSTPETQMLKSTSPYTKLDIRTPNGQVDWYTPEPIPITAHLEPSLAPGDQLQLFLDQEAVGNPQTSTQFQLPALERGSHQVKAVVFNAQKQTRIESRGLTLYQHQRSNLN